MSKLPHRPLIVHVVYRLATGGLENGLVNLINALPTDLARHRVIALAGVDPVFLKRITAADVDIENLALPTGKQTLRLLPRLYQRFRHLRPALVHTRNLSTIECQFAAWGATVPARIHGEHGWDEADQYGRNQRYTRLRKFVKNIVHAEVALSERTGNYLRSTVGVRPDKVREIHNGVETGRFFPARDNPTAPNPAGWPFGSDDFVIGTVGRLASIKNQALLCHAFVQMRKSNPEFLKQARLLLVGSGTELATLMEILEAGGAAESAWFTGDRADVPELMRTMSLFCLPSKAEGLSNSILEAMATGLPVVATDVGGADEQIEDGVTGTLIPSEDLSALILAVGRYFQNPSLCETHGVGARRRIIDQFDLSVMVNAYHDLYSEFLPAPHQNRSIRREISA